MKIYWIASPFTHEWALWPARKLQERGHEVVWFCPGDSPAARRARELGLAVREVHYPGRLKDVGAAWRCLAALRRIFRAEHPDVVFYYMIPVSYWGRLAAWMAGVPVRVYKPPSLWELAFPWYRLLESATAWMDTLILVSSRALESFYRAVPGGRTRARLSYYGCSLDRFDPQLSGDAVRREFGIPLGDPVVGMVSYFIPPVRRIAADIGIKGHEVLLRAAAAIVAGNPRVKFLIVGDEPRLPGRGDYARRIREMAGTLGLEKNVIFAGHREDIPAVLAAMDIVAVPSLSENVGGAVEPLLMEKPVVASRTGGLPDVVREGETGFLVPPRDADALASALLRALALSPAERHALGANGRRLVSGLFDLDRVVDREAALFREALAAQGLAHGPLAG